MYIYLYTYMYIHTHTHTHAHTHKHIHRTGAADGVGESWYKARIQIDAADSEWTARAATSSMSSSAHAPQVFTFGPPRH